jgi:hypothetical protein
MQQTTIATTMNGKPSEEKMKTDLSDYANRRSTTGPYADNLDVDVLIVGGGFGMMPVL